MTDDDLIITTAHLYTTPTWTPRRGYCAAKSREWFAAHGLSWSDFVQRGIKASILLATGDALAINLVEHARRVEAQQGGQ